MKFKSISVAPKITKSRLFTTGSSYGLAYFDTGMVYRAVGLRMLLEGKDLADVESAELEAGNLSFAKMIELSKHRDFRSAKGGEAASIVSSYTGVRSRLLDMQRNFAKNPTYAVTENKSTKN